MPPKSSSNAKTYRDPMMNAMMAQRRDDYYIDSEETGTEDADTLAQQLLQMSKDMDKAAAAAAAAGGSGTGAGGGGGGAKGGGSEAGNSDDFDADVFADDFEGDDDDGSFAMHGSGGGNSKKKKGENTTTPAYEALMATLPRKIRLRVLHLLELDKQYLALEKPYLRRREQLKRQFERDVAGPIMLQRRNIICGAEPPTDELIEEGFPLLHQTVGIALPTMADPDEPEGPDGRRLAVQRDNDDDDSDDSDAGRRAPAIGGGAANRHKKQQQQQQPEKKPANKAAAAVKPASTLESSPAMQHQQRQGLPEFWLRALKHHVVVDSLISERDEEVLRYCTDVSVATIEPQFGDGFIVRFEFARNPLFRNKALIKTFHTKDDDEEDELVVDFTSGTKIVWTSPEQNVTTKIITHKVRAAAAAAGGKGGKGGGAGGSGKAKRATRTVKKQVRINSFFRFFFDEITDPEDAELEDAYAYDDVEEDQWFGLGLTLQDKIVPYAVEHYTGEASNGESDLEDDDSDWDDDEYEEDFEEEEEEEVVVAPPAPSKKKSSSGAAPAAAAAPSPQSQSQQQQLRQSKDKPQNQNQGSAAAAAPGGTKQSLSAAAKLAAKDKGAVAGGFGGAAGNSGKDAECKQQ